MPETTAPVRRCAPLLAAAVVLCAGPVPCPAAGDDDDDDAIRRGVTYTVTLDRPQMQMVDIAATFPDVLGTSLEVALPVWRPGKYAILDAAGTVRDVRASYVPAGSDGSAAREAPIVKKDKSTWRISLPPRSASDAPPHEVTVSYRVYANSLADRTRHVDDSHAFLSGSAVFMYAEAFRDRPVRVVVDAPEGWRTATGLSADPAGGGAFLRESYDVLVDSPLEIGLHDVVTFEVGGVEHEVAAWPPGRLARDAGEMTADFAAIVRAQQAIFGDLPYDRYVYILHLAPGLRGGTEHLNSFVAQAAPGTLEDDGRYRGFLGLISHEHFHTWNVKRLRPADLKPYDYRRENYTSLLWVVEGTTSYYDDLCLVRASRGDGRPLLDEDEHLDRLSEMINDERARPGGAVQSLAESSFDAWIKFSRPTPDSVNSTVSFYSRGALVSLLLDLEVRARTGGRVSLDDVMRELYRRFPLDGPGYTAADMLKILEELTGTGFSGFFDEHISRPSSLPIERVAGAVGLELVFDAEEDEGGSPAQEAYLGLRLSDSGGRWSPRPTPTAPPTARGSSPAMRSSPSTDAACGRGTWRAAWSGLSRGARSA